MRQLSHEETVRQALEANGQGPFYPGSKPSLLGTGLVEGTDTVLSLMSGRLNGESIVLGFLVVSSSLDPTVPDVASHTASYPRGTAADHIGGTLLSLAADYSVLVGHYPGNEEREVFCNGRRVVSSLLNEALPVSPAGVIDAGAP